MVFTIGKSRVLIAAIIVLAFGVMFQVQAKAKGKGKGKGKGNKADVFTLENSDLSSADGHVTGSATLKRKKEGIQIEVKTSELIANNAYTNWWIIFNNPEFCDADPCGSDDDFSNPDVEASVLYATGRTADADGNSTYRAFLPVGLLRLNRTEEGRERHRFGPGLQDPKNAEVQYIIRCHGPASDDASELHEQLSTVGGLCSADNICFDAQAIVFERP